MKVDNRICKYPITTTFYFRDNKFGYEAVTVYGNNMQAASYKYQLKLHGRINEKTN